VGAALGEAREGRPLEETSPAGEVSEIERHLRHEFRQLHKGRDRIEPYLAADGLSREAAQAHAVEIAAVASRRMAEVDPPQRLGRGRKVAAPAATLPHQRRSENRDLLVLDEAEVRER